METSNTILFLASTNQVASDFAGEQGFIHLILLLDVGAVCTSPLMVGFISMDSRCPTWLLVESPFVVKKYRCFLKYDSSDLLSTSVLGAFLEQGEIMSFSKNSSVRRGISDALGRQAGLPFLGWACYRTLPSHCSASPQQIQAQQCVFWHTPAWGGHVDMLMLTLLWGYSAQPLLIRAKVDSTVCYVSGHQEAAD